ncbi:MAG: hypothetical protein ACFFBZ_15900 [Promethearchaeota archaeon]
MICKHGLDEVNCPICRISTSTRPFANLNSERLNINPLKTENPFLKKHTTNKKKLERSLYHIQNTLQPNFIHEIPEITTIHQIPDFGNKVFKEQLKNIDISKSDKFGISKKISLTNPELDLESED